MNQISEFKGKIDNLSASAVAGWAQYENTSSGPVELQVFYADDHLGDVTANEARPDLSRAGKGECAFTFSLPDLDDFNPDDLSVVVKGSDTPLPRSWSPNLANTREVRNELAELTETVKLTRKVLLAASSRNERALVGMAETVEKVTPRQLNETLNTLSYQLMQSDTVLKTLKTSSDETDIKLLSIMKLVRSNAFYAKLNTAVLAALVCLLAFIVAGQLGLVVPVQ